MPQSHRELRRSGDPGAVDALHALLAEVWLDVPSLDARVRARVATALGELLNNVVEHGRTPDGGTPQVRLIIEVGDGRVAAELRDDGVAVPADPAQAQLPEDPFGETGRGLALARLAVDRCEYVRRANENVWTLELALDVPEG